MLMRGPGTADPGWRGERQAVGAQGKVRFALALTLAFLVGVIFSGLIYSQLSVLRGSEEALFFEDEGLQQTVGAPRGSLKIEHGPSAYVAVKSKKTVNDDTVPGRSVEIFEGRGTPGSSVTLAYCYYENSYRHDYPNTEARWLVREIAKGMTAYYGKVRVISAAPDEKYVRLRYRDTAISDEQLWNILGLDADFRVCWFGQTSLIETIQRLRNATILRLPIAMAARHMSWTSEARMVSVPNRVAYVGDPTTKARVGPVHIRLCFEPWSQYVRGVEIQLETKRESLPSEMVSVYVPFALISIGRRTPLVHSDNISSWTKSHGCCIPQDTGVEEVVVRRGLFDPNSVLLAKRYFASFVQSHCHKYRHTTAIRTAFAYELADKVAPVSSLGHCPRSQAALRLGLSREEREARLAKYNHASSVDLHHDHKFAIVFENGPCDGYITEKIVDAYLAQAIPIYFGPEDLTLRQVLNPDAYVHCNVPAGLVTDKVLNAKFKESCPPGAASHDCETKFDLELQKRLSPHFASCIERVKELDANPAMYKKALAAPLVAHGELAGVWNMTFLASTLNGVRTMLTRPVTDFDQVRALFRDNQELPSYYFPPLNEET